MLASLSAPGLGPLQARCARGPQPRRARSSAPLFIRASDDEDVVPVISGRFKKGFSADDMERLRHPHLLGGRTIGEELGIIRERYLKAEQQAEEQEKQLNSSQWDGDQYIGGRWNTLSVLYLIFLAAPAAVGLFAYLSYGRLWGVTPGLY